MLVSQRKGRGGRTFDYLEGHAVIDQANRIFGYGGWGYELVGDVTLRTDRDGRSPDRRGEGLAQGYSAPGPGHRRRALCPAPTLGVHPVTEDNLRRARHGDEGRSHRRHEAGVPLATACSSATGSTATSSRRANGSTQAQRAPVQANGPAQPQRVPSQANGSSGSAPGPGQEPQASRRWRLSAQAAHGAVRGEQGFDEAQVQAAVQRQTGKSIDDLTADELGSLIEAAANKFNQMREAQSLPRT